jgi:hypothetical protein
MPTKPESRTVEAIDKELRKVLGWPNFNPKNRSHVLYALHGEEGLRASGNLPPIEGAPPERKNTLPILRRIVSSNKPSVAAMALRVYRDYTDDEIPRLLLERLERQHAEYRILAGKVKEGKSNGARNKPAS